MNPSWPGSPLIPVSPGLPADPMNPLRPVPPVQPVPPAGPTLPVKPRVPDEPVATQQYRPVNKRIVKFHKVVRQQFSGEVSAFAYAFSAVYYQMQK